MSISTGTSVFWSFGGAFKGLSSKQRTEYKEAWDWFEIVQNSNAAISSIGSGQYIRFLTAEQKEKFTLGQFLHQKVYPTDNFQSIPNR